MLLKEIVSQKDLVLLSNIKDYLECLDDAKKEWENYQKSVEYTELMESEYDSNLELDISDSRKLDEDLPF